MKEQIRKEVMKVYDQEASVDEVVEKLLVLFNVVGQSEHLCDKFNREKHLQKLIDQAQELNLGYDD